MTRRDDRPEANRVTGTDGLGQQRTVAQRHPRHPAEVTSDRLLDAVDRWRDKFEADERDMIGWIRHALAEIAEGKR